MKHTYTFRLQYTTAGFVRIDAETPQDAIDEYERHEGDYVAECDFSYDKDFVWTLIEEDGKTIEQTQEE